MHSPASNSDDVFALHGSEYQMPGGVTRHIRDVMNRELPPQHGQRLSCAVATTRAIDDLEHYHRLMADALREQQFTEDEASLLVSVCQDWFVCCPWEASRLWHELNDYLEIQEFETGDDTARPRWQRALVERLRNLSPLQACQATSGIDPFATSGIDPLR